MRRTYPCSPETRQVFFNNTDAIAEAMCIDASGLRKVVANTECDVFEKFMRWLDGAVDADVDVTPWTARINATLARRDMPSNIHELLAEKVVLDASTTQAIVQAVKDDEMDDHEKREIQQRLQR
jgi:hypothetical protein